MTCREGLCKRILQMENNMQSWRHWPGRKAYHIIAPAAATLPSMHKHSTKVRKYFTAREASFFLIVSCEAIHIDNKRLLKH
jgi:hypothetical protein